MLASQARGPHNLDRRRLPRGLHGTNPRHRPTLRPLLSSQIRLRKLENQQVSVTRHARTLDREPTRVWRATRISRCGSAQLLLAVSGRMPGAHPGRTTLVTDGGSAMSRSAGRMGRRTSSPPQFGQTPCRMFSAHSRHQVHSYVQISTSGDAGSRSRSQHSQFGRSSSTCPVSAGSGAAGKRPVLMVTAVAATWPGERVWSRNGQRPLPYKVRAARALTWPTASRMRGVARLMKRLTRWPEP